MELISVEEYQKKVEPILKEVFNESIFDLPDQITNPFNDSIDDYVFLRESIDPFYEQPRFWFALKAAVRELNDTVIYRTDTLEEYCHACSLDEEWTLALYEAMVSPSGQWGLHRDSTTITFLGGTRSFMDKVRSLYPEIDDQLADYLEDYATGDPDRPWGDRFTLQPWLPKLLLRSYGEERGRELIEKAKKLRMYFDPDDGHEWVPNQIDELNSWTKLITQINGGND